jgi:hypothetical protein
MLARVSALLAAALLLSAASADAVTFAFGSGSLSGTPALAGNAADRSATSTASNTATSFNVRGQASADHGITTNPNASADLTITYTIPYTVTRTVTVTPGVGGPATAAFESATLTFDVTFSGSADKDNSQTTGGLGQATVFAASISSNNGFFALQSYSGAALTGGGGLARSPFTRTTVDPTYGAGVNFSGPVRTELQVDMLGIPTDWRAWQDFAPPGAADYSVPFNVIQTFTDTLTVTFRLRAESRPSGSISVTGGEAIACAGQTSTLGSFALDNAANCGTGFTGNVGIVSNGFTIVAVPEPGTIALLGIGLAGIAAFATRKRV